MARNIIEFPERYNALKRIIHHSVTSNGENASHLRANMI